MMKKVKYSFKKFMICGLAAAVCLGVLLIPSPARLRTRAAVLPGGISDNQLFGYWKFDETSGNTANDSSGNGRHLQKIWNNGQMAGSFSSDGEIEDYEKCYTFTAHDAFKLTGNTGFFNSKNQAALVGGSYADKPDNDKSFTLSMNIKTSQWAQYSATANERGRTGGYCFNTIMGPCMDAAMGASTGSMDFSILDFKQWADKPGPNNLSALYGDPSRTDRTATAWDAGFPPDPWGDHKWMKLGTSVGYYTSEPVDHFTAGWQNILIVCSDTPSTSSMKIYINGELSVSQSLGGAKGLNKRFGDPADNLMVGATTVNPVGISVTGALAAGHASGGIIRPFIGKMNEVMLFSRALTPLEIGKLTLAYGFDGFEMPPDEPDYPQPVPPESSLVTFWVNNGFADISAATEEVEYGGAVSQTTIDAATLLAKNYEEPGKVFLYWNGALNYVTGTLNVYPVYGTPGDPTAPPRPY